MAITINDHIAGRLRTEPIIWLGTANADARPHLVPVWFFWNDQEEILIFSKPENRKIRNIRQNPAVALALNSPTGEDVVLLEGKAEILDTPAQDLLSKVSVDKYTPMIQRMGWTAESFTKDYSQVVRITLNRVNSW